MDEVFGVGERRDWFETLSLPRAIQGAAVLYEAEPHYNTALYMPLEPVLLGKHSAHQGETTVVLPCCRNAALHI